MVIFRCVLFKDFFGVSFLLAIIISICLVLNRVFWGASNKEFIVSVILLVVWNFGFIIIDVVVVGGSNDNKNTVSVIGWCHAVVLLSFPVNYHCQIWLY